MSELTEKASRKHSPRRKTDAMAAAEVLSASADGLMGIDAGGRIRIFNRALQELTGISQEDAIGRRYSDVIGIKDSSGTRLCESACPVEEGQSGAFDVEGELTTADGRKVAVDLNFAISCDDAGKLKMAVVNVRDASKLHQIDHIRSVLLASISHELQTPISIIKAYASTLARADAKWSEETVREKLKAIEEESDRLSALVSRFLYTSRLEAGAVSLNLMLVDLAQEAQRVARRLAEVDETHEILASFPPDFPPVTGDPERLDTVLTNLIENALKFSPRGGTVTVEASMSDDEVYVTVGDQGIGISQHDQEHVFERFYRSTDPPASFPPGTGLGLYICRTLVQAHGGHIWVESDPDQGSRFTFSLPRAREG
jgi:PAS domain S-box-containing protein